MTKKTTEAVVPTGRAGPKKQVTIRYPLSILERIDEIAKSTHNSRSEVLLRLLTYALDESGLGAR